VILKNEEEMMKMNNEKMGKLEINGFLPITKTQDKKDKRNQSVGTGSMNKSKDKNFRIMKKTLMEKKEEPFGVGNFGLMVVTGLGHQSNQPNMREGHMLPPKFRSNLNMGSYR
jgi:hypothetical protein